MDGKINLYHLDLFVVMYSSAFLDEFIDNIKEMGCNGVLLELADRMHYKSVPDFGSADALSQEEMRAFCDKIRGSGMVVVPLLQHLGHLNHLLKHEAYAHLREDPSTSYSICPLHPETVPTLKAILKETLDVIGDVPYVHLGGDETHHLGDCGLCSDYVDKHSKSGLYMDHYTPLCEMIIKRGERPMLWHDMIISHPENLASIPRETIFLDWNYGRSSSHESKCSAWNPNKIGSVSASEYDQVEPAEWRETFRSYILNGDGTVNPYFPTDYLLEKGFDVILGSACRCGGDSFWFPKNTTHYPNLIDTARFSRNSKVLGQCITDWSLRHASPGTRMLGIAMGLWGASDELDISKASSRFASEFCGLPDSDGAKLLQASSLLSPAPAFSYPTRIDMAVQISDLVNEAKDLDVDKECAELAKLRKGFEEASGILSEVISKAVEPGAAWLAQWLLAADALILRTFIAESVLKHKEDEINKDRAQELLKEIDILEKRTRELYKPIFSSESLEEHIVVRFAGDRKFLKEM